MLINKCILLISLVSIQAVAQTYTCPPTHKLWCDPTACHAESEGFQVSEVYLWDSKTQLLTACMGESCFEGQAHILQKSPLKLWAALRSTDPDRASAPPVFDVLLDIDTNQRFRVLMGDTQSNTLIYGQCHRHH